MQVQAIHRNEAQVRVPGYLTLEPKYHHDHPDVELWTKHYKAKAAKQHVFANIDAALERRRPGSSSRVTAEIVAGTWRPFTSRVPKFLAEAVSKTDDPEWQHYLIQIAYDELGGNDKTRIHSKLFEDALAAAGIALREGSSDCPINKTLAELDGTLAATVSPHAILGLLTAFEINAEQNIETLFNGLGRDPECVTILSEHMFFQIHRVDEIEHIRHSVANFLRFCTTDLQRAEFDEGFDDGIDFWRSFWDQCACMINREASECASIPE